MCTRAVCGSRITSATGEVKLQCWKLLYNRNRKTPSRSVPSARVELSREVEQSGHGRVHVAPLSEAQSYTDSQASLMQCMLLSGSRVLYTLNSLQMSTRRTHVCQRV
jgi:hypothetical protein